LQQQISKFENDKVEQETEMAQKEHEKREQLLPLIRTRKE
jgi:hypothetical protein